MPRLRLSKQNRIRIKYGVLLSPALFLSIGVAIFVLVRTQSQYTLSRKIQILLFPLLCIHILCWALVFFLLLIYVGIMYPFRAQPGFAFGWSVGMVFLALLSVFVVRNYVASTVEYEMRMRRFSLVTSYQRRVTRGQLSFLYENNNLTYAEQALQNKQRCCGLTGYQDYNRASGRFDAINANNDKDDSRFASCRHNLTWNAYLHNLELDLSNRIEKLPPELALGPDEDVPVSCCRKPGLGCNKNIFQGDADRLKNIYTSGCVEYLTQHIHACHDLLILTLLFLLPWILLLYTLVVSWAHLREVQGLRFCQCAAAVSLRPKSEEEPDQPPSLPPPKPTITPLPSVSSSTSKMPKGTYAISQENKNKQTRK